jgi:predicted pyridoxine 5'-phosphate oxidase superfamily flavin-nucleotide-binding protein
MGAAAAVRAQAEFSTERCADRHVEAYTQALRFARRSSADADSKPYVGRSPNLTSYRSGSKQ